MKTNYHLSPLEITKNRVKALKTGLGVFPSPENKNKDPNKITPEMRKRIATLTSKVTKPITYNCLEDALAAMREEINPNKTLHKMDAAAARFRKSIVELDESLRRVSLRRI